MRLGLVGCLVAAVLTGLCRGLDDVTARPGNGSNAISDMLSSFPSCSRDCYATGLAGLHCSDTACVCSDPGFEDHVRGCVVNACHRVDGLAAKNLTDTACQRRRGDRSASYTVMSIVMGSVASVVVGIRFLFKYSRRRIAVDDFIILSSLAVGIPCTALNVQGLVRHGIGRDVWTLQTETVTDFVFFFYLLEIFYVAMMALVKMAMCFFYLSIFPGTRIRQVLWATTVVNVLIGVASVLTSVFQCSPVRFYWTMYAEPEAGSCIDIHMLAWVHGGVNIALNFWLIAIPLSQVRGLGLHWKKKVGVVIMFLTGTFDTIVSILRLQSLILFANSWNPTWDQWNVAWWSTIEINVGLICTSLPALRLLLMQFAPRVFGSGRASPS
ncbi:Extracellular membrane protein, CFEM domain protein [Ophiocordyceps sinensis CO18]|uniref:Extracellular membrane protein, CFEM domain protein n=1 Tax=Ophiocordyceps sinensis (strain Co18 / CGMCC 3.14243) TaxID=911162 RepID=T5A7G9_OPHSC|nr:Extracellular membrane protein, CFEM domain protein [Ophiocordyceps sinensis CO18]